MKKNLMKIKMEKGEPVVGTFLDFGNAENAEILAISPMDYIIIDCEHGPYAAETAGDMIRAIELHDCTPIARVQDHARSSVLKLLDVGARGLIIPMIFNPEEVKEIVRWGKYSPIGERGCCMARQCDYGEADICNTGNTQDYFDAINKETFIIPQCETVEALNCIEDIAAVEGVDGIFVGPFDLSTAMGIPGQFDNPELDKAIDRIFAACKANNKFCMIFCGTTERARKYRKKGLIPCVATDEMIYIKALKDAVRETLED